MMAKDRDSHGQDLALDERSPASLLGDADARTDDELFYDEDGSMLMGWLGAGDVGDEVREPTRAAVARPCPTAVLNGSWYLQFTPQGPHVPSEIRGPMRIEVGSNRIRISGDVYVAPFQHTHPGVPSPIGAPITPSPLIIKRNWYPHLPFKEYSWYFRSTGVQYAGGQLTFRFVRHLWHKPSEEFVSTDTGWMRLKCVRKLFSAPGLPQPTIRLVGEAMVGGVQYHVSATKTSPYYRGCRVEVDVMTKRNWPASGTLCGGAGTVTFHGVYRAAGLDVLATVDQVNVPEDASLTVVELQTLLGTHRAISTIGHTWQIWLLIGSGMGGTYGLMFDDTAPFREGAVGFADATLPDSLIVEASLRGKPLNEAPVAFLRTLVHEVGHVFNLYHPKHDVHAPPIGTTIMNQTGDVMGFSTAANPYPCNASFDFNEHNRDSLIHSPDPQVAPGWKRFGWGHGTLWSGVPAPVDATGLDVPLPVSSTLELRLELPGEAFLGELVVAKVTLINRDSKPHRVTTALNLAEGDMRLFVTYPTKQVEQVRDVVVICADRRMVVLEPGESIVGHVQLHYTNQEFTFDQPGRYQLQVELDTGEYAAEGRLVRSSVVGMLVRSPMDQRELDLGERMRDPAVGRSLALGDVGVDTGAEDKLEAIASDFADTQSGLAATLVIANSTARTVRNYREGGVARAAVPDSANAALDRAVQNSDAVEVMSLATAIVSPRDVDAPVLHQVLQRLESAGADQLEEAREVLADFLA